LSEKTIKEFFFPDSIFREEEWKRERERERSDNCVYLLWYPFSEHVFQPHFCTLVPQVSTFCQLDIQRNWEGKNKNPDLLLKLRNCSRDSGKKTWTGISGFPYFFSYKVCLTENVCFYFLQFCYSQSFHF